MILGIDIGGSTTKIVAYEGEQRIGVLKVNASDQLTALYGSLGHFLHNQNASYSDVEKIVLTGVGASLIKEDIQGIPTTQVLEFEAIGYGGLVLSQLSEALVVSMGTGTAFVHACEKGYEHLGGSGVGGGTLLGLSDIAFREDRIERIEELAKNGSLSKVDLTMKDISTGKVSFLPETATAANFGKVSNLYAPEDVALGLYNMVFQTAGMFSVFALRSLGDIPVVVTGSLAQSPFAQKTFDAVSAIYGIKFILPEEGMYATAIGALLLDSKRS